MFHYKDVPMKGDCKCKPLTNVAGLVSSGFSMFERSEKFYVFVAHHVACCHSNMATLFSHTVLNIKCHRFSTLHCPRAVMATICKQFLFL